jgi:VanZ family protein
LNTRRLIPAIAWFIVSLILLCLPGSALPKYSFLATIHADKWVHIFMFGVLCFLFCRAVNTISLPTKNAEKHFVLIMLMGIAYGIVMEFVQKWWIPNRSFELTDILADATGCVLGWLYSRNKFAGRV